MSATPGSPGYEELRVDFRPAPFAHDARVAVAMAPGGLALLALGGAPAFGIAAVGLLAAAAADGLALRGACLGAVWLTVLGVLGYTVLGSGAVFGAQKPWPVPLAACLLLTECAAVLGCWATLQFRWLQFSHCGAVAALERLVVAGAPLVGAAMGAWLCLAALGAETVAVWLCVLLCINYWALGAPLPSSFGDVAVVGASEAALTTTATLLFPAALHVAIHAMHLWRAPPGAPHGAAEVWAALALLGTSLLVVCAASLRGALDFLELRPKALALLRSTGAVFATLLLVLGLEMRVVMVGYSHLVPLLEPWNFIVVGAAMFLLAAPAAVHFLNRSLVWEPGYEPLGEVAASVCLLGGTGALTLALGAPMWLTPFPLCAAAMLVQYYFTRLVRDYLIFWALTGCVLAWGLHTFILPLGIAPAGESAAVVCTLAFCAAMLAIILPGVVFSGNQALGGWALVCCALAIAALEDRLAQLSLLESLAGLYPPWAVLATSVLGLAACRHLAARGIVKYAHAVAAAVGFGAKLALLVVPQRGATMALGLMAAAAAPGVAQAATWRGPGGKVAAGSSRSGQRGGMRGGAEAMPGAAAVALAIALLGAIAHARNAMFDLAFLAGGERPTDAFMLGLLLMLYAALAAPLASLFPRAAGARGALLATAGAGLLVAAVAPPLPESWGHAMWDAAHQPVSEASDAEFYRGEATARVAWPAWLLVAAGAAALWAIAAGSVRGTGPLGASSASRGILNRSSRLADGVAGGGAASGGARLAARAARAAAVGAGAALATALYVALEFFPPIALLQLAVALGATCLLSAVALVQARTATAPALVPLLFCLGVSVLPVGLIALPREREAYALAATLGAGGEALVEGAEASLLAVHAAACALLAFSLRLAIGNARAAAALNAGGGGGGKGIGAMGLAAARRAAAHALSAGGVRSMSRTLGTVWWMASVGNAAAALAFALGCALNTRGGSGGAGAHANIFALAPLLLLLNHDGAVVARAPRRLRGGRHGGVLIADTRRYLPVALAVVIYLSLASLFAAGRMVAAGEPRSALGETASLLACAPSHALLVAFLAGRRRPPAHALAAAPLNTIPLFTAMLPSTRWLAGAGAAAGVVQFFLQRAQRQRGLREL